jgi:uncharacterized membrane protein YhdT
MKSIILFSLIIVITLSVIFPSFALAQTDGIWKGITCFETGPCSLCDGIKLLANITDFLATISIILAGGLVIYGGIRILLPPGDAAQNFQNAKKIITMAVFGVIIVLSSWIIVNSVLHILTGKPDFPWSEISCTTIPEIQTN